MVKQEIVFLVTQEENKLHTNKNSLCKTKYSIQHAIHPKIIYFFLYQAGQESIWIKKVNGYEIPISAKHWKRTQTSHVWPVLTQLLRGEDTTGCQDVVFAIRGGAGVLLLPLEHLVPGHPNKERKLGYMDRDLNWHRNACISSNIGRLMRERVDEWEVLNIEPKNKRND